MEQLHLWVQDIAFLYALLVDHLSKTISSRHLYWWFCVSGITANYPGWNNDTVVRHPGGVLKNLDPILITIIAMSALGVLLGAICGVVLYCACWHHVMSQRNLSALENYNFELVDGVKLKKDKLNTQNTYSEAWSGRRKRIVADTFDEKTKVNLGEGGPMIFYCLGEKVRWLSWSQNFSQELQWIYLKTMNVYTIWIMYSWLFCSLLCFWIIRCWCWDQLWSILWFCNLCFVFVLFSATDTSRLCTEARMRSRDNTEWGCFERAQRPLRPTPYASLDSQDDYFMFVHICLCCNKGLGSPTMCHYDVFWHFWSKAFHYCCVSVLFWSIVLKKRLYSTCTIIKCNGNRGVSVYPLRKCCGTS